MVHTLLNLLGLLIEITLYLSCLVLDSHDMSNLPECCLLCCGKVASAQSCHIRPLPQGCLIVASSRAAQFLNCGAQNLFVSPDVVIFRSWAAVALCHLLFSFRKKSREDCEELNNFFACLSSDRVVFSMK
jgi:hypothetical protein